MKAISYLALAILIAYGLSLVRIQLFSLDEVSLFITVIGLIYGLIAAFTINSAWERFSKIRDCIAQEMNGLVTLAIFAKQLSDKKSVEKLRTALLEYCDDVPRVDWNKYWESEATHAKFRRLVEIVAETKVKTAKDVELFDEVAEELRIASSARNTQLILAKTHLSSAHWMLNIFLSTVVVLGLVTLSLPNILLSTFIVTSMVAAVIMILFVIYELDSMKFAETEISCEPYANVIRIVSEGKIQPDIALWYKEKSVLPNMLSVAR